MLPIEEERALVKKAKSGSQQAFTDLIADCSDKIRGGLFKYLKDEDLTSDIYQLALIKAWKKIKTFKGDARFSTWVYRISTNLCYDFFRKKKRENSSSLEALLEENPHLENLFLDASTQHHASRDMEMSELGKQLKEVLGCLSPDHRLILELFAKEDMSYEEISKETNIPIGTVMSRLFYARKKARKHYERESRKEESKLVGKN